MKSVQLALRETQAMLDLDLTLKAPNTTIAEFANTADSGETAHDEPSHLDLQCLSSSLEFSTLKVFFF